MSGNNKKIQVMLVDDSAVVRQTLTDILSAAPDMEVIASVMDPIFAMERLKRKWPDVIVLDIEMPRMDGVTFLKKLMAERPVPVVICSTLAVKGSQTAFEALSAGAVDMITKPTVGVKRFFEEYSESLINAVRGAASADVAKLSKNVAASPSPAAVAPKLTADAMLAPAKAGSMVESTDKLVAIGTSTGGTQALEIILPMLPRVTPGIVIVQHMPEKFTQSFARRLDKLCQIEVREAVDGDRVITGTALIAPGGFHMLVERKGAQYRVAIQDGPRVCRHRPSVDVLFRSVANAAGRNAVGIIMTGMGDDGARGMKEMFDAGAHTVAQDEASSIVYGMPREAVRLGAVHESLPLTDIPGVITRAFSEQVSRKKAARQA